MAGGEWVGALLGVVATMCASTGDNLVKYSYNYLKREGLDRAKRWSREPAYVWPNTLFFTGWGFTTVTIPSSLDVRYMTTAAWQVLAVILNGLAFKVAPASLVVPTSGCHIVWNVYLSWCVNREVLSRGIIGDTLLILLGVIFVCISAPKVARPAGGFCLFSILPRLFYRALFARTTKTLPTAQRSLSSFLRRRS